MADQTPGNENNQENNQEPDSENEEFHSPLPAPANIAPEQNRNRPGARRGLRSNTVIRGRPQDVGRIIQRSRSRSQNRNPPASSDDNDDEEGSSSDNQNNNDDAKLEEQPPSASSSVHPERQIQVAAANENAIANISDMIAARLNENDNQNNRENQANRNNNNNNRQQNEEQVRQIRVRAQGGSIFNAAPSAMRGGPSVPHRRGSSRPR